MRCRLIIIVAILAIVAAGCGAGVGTGVGAGAGEIGVDVEPSMPGISSGLTEAGNPGDGMENAKGIYVNREFGVTITYPVDWTLIERGSIQAEFRSPIDEYAIVTFVRLADCDFVSFLAEVGDGDAWLMSGMEGFEEGVCSAGEGEAECYYFKHDPDGDFVMSVVGDALGSFDMIKIEVAEGVSDGIIYGGYKAIPGYAKSRLPPEEEQYEIIFIGG